MNNLKRFKERFIEAILDFMLSLSLFVGFLELPASFSKNKNVIIKLI